MTLNTASSLDSAARLAAIRATGLLDGPPDAAFDRLVHMAAKLVDASAALITLVTDSRQFFVSQTGMMEPWSSDRGSSLHASICQFVVSTSAPVLVENSRTDPRTADIVARGELPEISYCGVPLYAPDGAVLGTVGAIADAPRQWTSTDVALLQEVAATAQDEIALRIAGRAAQEAAIEARVIALAIREGHDLLNRMSAHVPGVLYQFQLWPDGRTCIPFASVKLVDIFGVAPTAVREDASAIYSVLHPDDLNRVRASIASSAADLSVWRLEYRTCVPSQGVRWRRGEAQPERLADGSTLWHGFITDITAERELQAQRNELEVQLQHAQKMEAIGTLASGVAHDFNNVLTAILGNVESVRMTLDGAHPGREPLEDAYAAARRAKALVAQILAFSRRRPAERTVLVLWPVLEEVWRLMRATLPTTITMEAGVDDAEAMVRGDPTQLHQVLLNLCTNAATAMRGGPGHLTLRQAKVVVAAGSDETVDPLPPGDYVRITLTDTGDGMNEETRKRIFEPFFTTRATGEGTGLGLTMVYAIVKNHDGGVGIESTRGAGTSMHVYLPLLRVGAPTDRSSTPLPISATGAGPSKGRVLVVDDEGLVGRAAEHLLVRLGYTPIIFTNPVEALAWMRARPRQADAVLTDLTMPEMDGIHLATQLRALREDLPITVCSGLLDDVAIDRLHTIGSVAMLEKPYTANELLAAMARAITLVSGNPREEQHA